MPSERIDDVVGGSEEVLLLMVGARRGHMLLVAVLPVVFWLLGLVV